MLSAFIKNKFCSKVRLVLINKTLILFNFRFAVNLQQNAEPCDGEVAFHFNPRPGEQECVRNSFDGGSWMDEERDQPHFPFDEGRSFTLRIEVAEEAFRTYVNGKPYINFAHRLDMGNVHFLYLTEGAEFYDISYQDRYVCNLSLISYTLVNITMAIKLYMRIC